MQIDASAELRPVAQDVHARLESDFPGRRYDAATDRYVETTWDEAFQDIGARLRTLDPKTTVFYTSGRASLEASYLFALFARLYGHNNLPDSSNMCHETTSVALKRTFSLVDVDMSSVRIRSRETPSIESASAMNAAF